MAIALYRFENRRAINGWSEQIGNIVFDGKYKRRSGVYDTSNRAHGPFERLVIRVRFGDVRNDADSDTTTVFVKGLMGRLPLGY